jgi:hypothetical protein
MAVVIFWPFPYYRASLQPCFYFEQLHAVAII